MRLLRLLAPLASLMFAATATIAAPVRILPVGDSLTNTYPGYRAPLFLLLRDAGHEVEFVGPKKDNPKTAADPKSLGHAGVGGFTIGPGPSKADAWTGGKGNIYVNVDEWLKSQPDFVLLLIGVNDYFNIGDLDKAYKADRDGPARLAGLLDKIHAASPKSRILVSSILPVGWDKNFAKPFNAAIPALVAERPYCTFADLNKLAGFGPGDWSKDNLHPSDQGYAKMAKAWAEVLQPLLAKR